MKLTLKIAKVLMRLINGDSVPNSSAKGKIIEDLIAENILFRKGKHKKRLELVYDKDLRLYLANQLQINNLYNYISALENEDSTRAEFVKITTDSKHSKERAFKGFLINSFNEIKAELNGMNMIISPNTGSFIFIYDYKTFKIPKEITVVGVENAKNFRHIQEQKYLFETIHPLFISRYPQNQNKDFIKWMKSIPNNYLHFGDFDMAGIGIYLNEYKAHLLNKASFFIPENIEDDLQKNGNRERYNKQKTNFEIKNIEEPEIKELIRTINSQKKGLDQEFYITD
jgi:hypothetical protein